MTAAISGSTPTSPLQLTVHPLAEESNGQFWSGDAPSFQDLLDTINPLQHIPGISSIYQYITGDSSSSGANIVGGALFGGPIGLISSVIGEIVKMHTGSDVAGSLLALVSGDSSSQMADAGSASYAPSPVNKAAYNAYQRAQSLSA